jgi:formylglycine-generating enzyme required for sulfatase activity
VKRRHERGSLLHPVEQVDWWECNETLERLGLVLPSEAQWEYGARAGSATPWSTGEAKESLSGAANLADRYAQEHGGEGWESVEVWLDDGKRPRSRRRFAPNDFGLHDVHGNVWEWCRDVPSTTFYKRSPHRDPRRRGSRVGTARHARRLLQQRRVVRTLVAAQLQLTGLEGQRPRREAGLHRVRPLSRFRSR